jgi:hypothetical protein
LRLITCGVSSLSLETTSGAMTEPWPSVGCSTSPSQGPSVPRLRFFPVRFGTVTFKMTLWVKALCDVSGLAAGLS